MAKVTIIGNAAVITSSLKLEKIKLIEKNCPEALILKGGESGKEPIFRIGTTDGAGTISKYGAEFDGESRDGEKLATITLVFDLEGGEGDVKEYFVDAIGGALAKLNEIEAALPAVVGKVEADRAEILASITVQ